MTTKISQNKTDNLLAILFTSSARVVVLRTFLIDPLRSYYQRQLETATGLPIRAVQRELDRLTDSGLLYRRLEGRRAYYTIDRQFVGFEALRSLFLSDSSPLDRLRATLALQQGVILAFSDGKGSRVLVVYEDKAETSVGDEFEGINVGAMSRSEFVECLEVKPKGLEPFLKNGNDILGRREDLVWRRIESAGFSVEKEQGVP